MQTTERIDLMRPAETKNRLDALEEKVRRGFRKTNEAIARHLLSQVKDGKRGRSLLIPRKLIKARATVLAEVLAEAEAVSRLAARYEVQAGHALKREKYPEFSAQFVSRKVLDKLIPNAGLRWYNDYALALVDVSDELVLSQVKDDVKLSIRKGETTDQAMERVAKTLTEHSDFRLERIVRTEVAKVYEQGRIKEFEAADEVVGYELSAILDSRLCPVCQSRDNVQVKKNELGNTRLTPPFHPFCRCIFLPVFNWEDEEGEVEWKSVPDDAPEVTKGFGYKDLKKVEK